MTVDSLKLFVEVAQRLSFAGAAKARGVDPSSVSRVIGQLEAQLGLRLFQRTTRTMTLTDAGALYLRRVRAVLEELEHAHEQARSLDQEPRGALRLTASVAFGERMIVPLVADYRARFPQVTLDLALTDANLDLVGEGIDLAIRLSPQVTGDVVATRLRATAYRVVASPAYLARAPAICKPRDLTAHGCTVFALPGFRSAWRFRPRQERLREPPEVIEVHGDLVVSSALSLRSLVLGGAGPALLADWLIDEDVRAGRLIDLFPHHDATATSFDTAAWLMYPSRAYLPHRVRVTVDFLKTHLGRRAPRP